MQYIDIHSHIHDKVFDLSGLSMIEQMKKVYIATVTVGTDYYTSLAAKKLAEANENVYYTIGVHPHDDVTAIFDENKFKDLLGPKCLAIGECGLDYFRLAEDKEKGIIENMDREVDRQQELFERQINFARENNLPLMLHGRPSEKNDIDNVDGMDAYHDMIQILTNINYLDINSTPSPLRGASQREAWNSKEGTLDQALIKPGIVHFFVGNIDIANKFMELGFDFSLGGVITITHDYDDMIKYLPIDRIHAETDSPYVVPRDVNGKRVSKINSPLNIEIIINKIAEIKNIEQEMVRKQLIENAKRVFDFSF